MTDQKIPDDGPAPTVDAERVPEPGWTGGEWRVSHRQNEPCQISGFHHIMPSGDRPACAYVHSGEDAKLIAASKDLYAALYNAAAGIRGVLAVLPNSPTLRQLLAGAEAALSKALGK